MKVVTLSKTFPVYHPRVGDPTDFGPLYLSGLKIHTIRANENGYYHDGDIVSVRQWSGKPYASKQETLEDGVRIGVVPVQLSYMRGCMSVRAGKIPCSPVVVGRNDGLFLSDFYDWFNPRMLQNLTLNWSIIHFTDYRYE